MRTEGTSSSTKVSSFKTSCSSCPLRTRPCFREFDKDELDFVNWFKRGELVVEPGSAVVQEASTSPHLFTVLEGWAFRYKTLADGRRQILNFALPAT
ncbi:CRP-like cAMP-binding protein [Amorphus orientalis]|uniref:CRP-like cAMP-binding protein n=1 Tax=Amorphus orientalis TaxID=649198 RepID=A0AAE4ATN2_9HYPH|nr:CRP-like cAMP-binding protein [Amorphus orientalis]